MLFLLILSSFCISVDVAEKSMNISQDKTFICFIKTNNKYNLFQLATLVIPTWRKTSRDGNFQFYSNLEESFLVRSTIKPVTAEVKDAVIARLGEEGMELYYPYFAGLTLDLVKDSSTYTKDNKPLVLDHVGTYIMDNESKPKYVEKGNVCIGEYKFFFEYFKDSLLIKMATGKYTGPWWGKEKKVSKCLKISNLIFNVMTTEGEKVVLGTYKSGVDNIKIIKNNCDLKSGFLDIFILFKQIRSLVYKLHSPAGKTVVLSSNEILKDDKKKKNPTTGENEGNEVNQGSEVKTGNRLSRGKLALIIIVILFLVVLIVLLCIYVYKTKKDKSKYDTEC